MNKKELAKEVAYAAGQNVVDVEVTLNKLWELLPKIMTNDTVEIRKFGCFKKVLRKEKIGRVVKLNKSIVVPEHYTPMLKFYDEAKNVFL